MNVSHCFADYLATTLGLVLGQDIFIGDAPSSNKAPDTVWWVRATGGAPIKKPTGECMKEYFVEVRMRSRDYRTVYDSLQSLEETLNCGGCDQLCDYDTVDITAAVLSVDNDLDVEDRKLGLLQANIRIYDDCSADVS